MNCTNVHVKNEVKNASATAELGHYNWRQKIQDGVV